MHSSWLIQSEVSWSWRSEHGEPCGTGLDLQKPEILQLPALDKGDVNPSEEFLLALHHNPEIQLTPQQERSLVR